MPIVTLTTDFGLEDGYVGAMKGAVLSVNPRAVIVDVTHHVPPQDIARGAFVLDSAYRYFPGDTVHVAVVDPGVGTQRRALVVDTPEGRFLAPDNGLLTYVLTSRLQPGALHSSPTSQPGKLFEPVIGPLPEGCRAYTLTRPEYWRHPVSDTFHGRDIFAPVAAHLSLRVAPTELGEPIQEVVYLRVPLPKRTGSGLEGRIMLIDRFGNLATNIPSSWLTESDVEVIVGNARIQGLSRTFADSQGLLALIGSHGHLEVALSGGSAADRLSARVGDTVTVLTTGVSRTPKAT